MTHLLKLPAFCTLDLNNLNNIKNRVTGENTCSMKTFKKIQGTTYRSLNKSSEPDNRILALFLACNNDNPTHHIFSWSSSWWTSGMVDFKTLIQEYLIVVTIPRAPSSFQLLREPMKNKNIYKCTPVLDHNLLQWGL